VRFPGTDHRDGRDREGDAAGGDQVVAGATEAERTDVAEIAGGFRRAVRGEDHELRLLRLRRPADLAQAEAHLAGLRRNPEGARDINHGTTSCRGSSGAGTGGG